MEIAWARVAAIGLAVVLIAAAAARLVLEHDEPGPPARPTVALEPSGSAAGAGGGPKPGPWVHVAGAVRRPGLYRVSAGARVAEALARAGGPSRRADLTAVNLAATVEDGQQVVVVARGAASAAGSSSEAGASVAGRGAQPVSLSQATLEQLDALDGIGPTLAARILAHGKEHGGFRSVDQLQEVEGIGPKRFEALRDAVRP